MSKIGQIMLIAACMLPDEVKLRVMHKLKLCGILRRCYFCDEDLSTSGSDATNNVIKGSDHDKEPSSHVDDKEPMDNDDNCNEGLSSDVSDITGTADRDNEFYEALDPNASDKTLAGEKDDLEYIQSNIIRGIISRGDFREAELYISFTAAANAVYKGFGASKLVVSLDNVNMSLTDYVYEWIRAPTIYSSSYGVDKLLQGTGYGLLTKNGDCNEYVLKVTSSIFLNQIQAIEVCNSSTNSSSQRSAIVEMLYVDKHGGINHVVRESTIKTQVILEIS